MGNRDIKEVIGLLLIGSGLASAYFVLPALMSPWLWGGLVVTMIGIIFVARSRPGTPQTYEPVEADNDLPLRRRCSSEQEVDTGDVN